MTRSRIELRPRPLVETAREQTPVPTAAGALLSALLLAGLITRGTFDVLSYVLAGAAILIGAATTYLAVRRTVRAGEQQVTPTADPRTDDGDMLVPRTEQLLADVLEQIAQLIITGPPDPAPPAAARAMATAPGPLPARGGREPANDPASVQLPAPDSGGRHASRQGRRNDLA